MSKRRKLQPAGTKRTMRISGFVLIASWLLLAFGLDILSLQVASNLMGQLGALGLVGIGLIIGSFVIKEKNKQGK